MLAYLNTLYPIRYTAFALCVLGLLLAALYQPVWTSTIHRPQDFVLSLLAFVALTFWKIPPWLVVLGGGAAAWGLNYAV